MDGENPADASHPLDCLCAKPQCWSGGLLEAAASSYGCMKSAANELISDSRLLRDGELEVASGRWGRSGGIIPSVHIGLEDGTNEAPRPSRFLLLRRPADICLSLG